MHGWFTIVKETINAQNHVTYMQNMGQKLHWKVVIFRKKRRKVNVCYNHSIKFWFCNKLFLSKIMLISCSKREFHVSISLFYGYKHFVYEIICQVWLFSNFDKFVRNYSIPKMRTFGFLILLLICMFKYHVQGNSHPLGPFVWKL
jgi:hypothetical protein